MSLYNYRAVANGLRTDHPIPDLPFVDDSHIPVEDAARIEKVGRRHGTGMWGREDPARSGGWVAFTTDPRRHDLAWIVRWHPDHGRSVILYRNGEASRVHLVFEDDGPLLFRSGGYWWDGAAWYRPGQVWDAASETYYRRLVPAAATVTAAAMLSDESADPGRGSILDIADVDPDVPYEGRWLDDLALWAQNRDCGSLAGSVVTLTAPELSADRMAGTTELAQITGIASSTLRAYIARGEAEVPLPQAVTGGRSLWSRPVAEEWAEQRKRSADGVTEAVSARGDGRRPPVPVGVADDAAGLARSFFARLWDYRPFRGRWALRWRNEDAVRQVAEDLGYGAADYMVRSLIPADALASTIEHAVLDELAYGLELHRETRDNCGLRIADPDDNDAADAVFFGIAPKVAQMLDWLIRHQPDYAAHVIGAITGEAERRFAIPRDVTERSLSTALSLDGELSDEALEEFLSRAMTPGRDRQ
jgi:hypothetical protein